MEWWTGGTLALREGFRTPYFDGESVLLSRPAPFAEVSRGIRVSPEDVVKAVGVEVSDVRDLPDQADTAR